jgi:hypothetical protein
MTIGMIVFMTLYSNVIVRGHGRGHCFISVSHPSSTHQAQGRDPDGAGKTYLPCSICAS